MIISHSKQQGYTGLGGEERAWTETPVTTTVAMEQGSKLDDYKTTYFPPETDEGKNRLLKWYEDNKEFLKTNIFPEEKHRGVLTRYTGSLNLYLGRMNALKRKATAKNEEVTNIDAYLAMIRSICVMKQKRTTEWNAQINPIMMSMEGNNRMGAFFHMLFQARYDAQEGKLVRGSINNAEFIQSLGEPADRSRKEIKEAMTNVDLKKRIRDTLDDDNSVFNKALIHMVVVYGVTDEEYKKMET